jgi:hypothetical protein
VADQAEHREDGAVAKRGEAKWKEAKERVAERNSQARKAGKQRREAYERQRAEVRRVAERRQMAELLAKRKTP